MSTGCLPQPNAHQYVIVVLYFMAFNFMFHPLSFHTKILRHTKPRGLGYKQWLYHTMCPHSHTRSTACTKPCLHTLRINCNIIPQKDTMIPYMAQPSYPLNSQDQQCQTIQNLLISILHSMVGYQFHCILWLTPFSRPSFPHFHILSLSHRWSNPMHTTIPNFTHRILLGLYHHLPSAIHLI